MVIDEGSRHDTFTGLQEVLGKERATMLMKHLPPVGWADVATKTDVGQLLAGTKNELLAGFHKELSTMGMRLSEQIVAQTRHYIFSMVGTMIAFGGVVVASGLI